MFSMVWDLPGYLHLGKGFETFPFDDNGRGPEDTLPQCKPLRCQNKPVGTRQIQLAPNLY